jgi:hypothetical protein
MMKTKWLGLTLIVLIFWIQAGIGAWAQAEEATAIIHVNLVPMTEEKILLDQTVITKESQIIAIGPTRQVAIPDNSTVIDGSNLYLMPGLADMHIHTDTRWLNGGWPVSPLDLFLASGVTTIRDFGPRGAPPDYALRWRNEIKKGRLRGPTLYAAGPILYGPVDNAEKIVRVQKEQGFDFVKLYSFLSAAEFNDAITTAQNLNLYTAGHIPFAVGLDGVLSAGMNEIAHIEELDFELLDFDRSRKLGHAQWFRYILQAASDQMGSYADSSMDEIKRSYQTQIKKIILQLKASDTPLCTTLTVGDVVFKKLFHPDRLASETTSGYLPYSFFELLEQGKNRHQIQFKGYEDFAPIHFNLNQLLLRELHKGGVTLVLGTDAGPMHMGLVPGFSVHDELRIMVKNGLTPYEALRLATVNAAEVINKMTGEGNFGTIAIGKNADLVLLNGNPLDDIQNTKKIQGVMASGQWFDKPALQEMTVPGIPVTAAVKHVYEQDKTHYTSFDIVIGKSYAGGLPGTIDAITVTGPSGKLPLQKMDFTYLRQLRNFWIKAPGKPPLGTYTIEVNSDTQKGSATVIQSVVKTILLPEAESLRPLNGATIKSVNPTFSWKTENAKEPLYYRLEINKPSGGRVYSTRYAENMRSHTIPEGVLRPGQSYRWRIRITDAGHWTRVQNSSRCAWQFFHIK